MRSRLERAEFGEAVIDTDPRVACRLLRITPAETRRTAVLTPAATEIFFDLIPATVQEARTRFPAITICGTIVVVAERLIRIRAMDVVVAPVCVLCRRIERLLELCSGSSVRS